MKKHPHDVLVLNRSYAPIHIITWKRAMSLIYQDKALSIDHVSFASYNFADWISLTFERPEDFYLIGSANSPVALPEIIVATGFNKLPDRQVKYSRQSVFSRDHFKCAYCGKVFGVKSLTIDHIVPRSKGGKTSWDNVITACMKCNQKKGSKLLHECSMSLLYQPTKPGWVSPLANVTKDHPCKSWKHFMNAVSISE